MKKRRYWGLFVLAFLLPALLVQATQQPEREIRFGPAIEQFLEQDETNPPPQDAILFIGSSIFRQWADLEEHMAPLPVFNRAFGGSRTWELLHYVDRVVLPYKPRIIAYYGGSNDVNAGADSKEIYDNFRAFAERVAKQLPATQIFFVSINRAPQKRDRWDVVDAANSLIREYADQNPKLGYIDVNPVLFDSAGNPRIELYRDDLLHFHPPAYVEFAKVVRPVIEKEWNEGLSAQ